MREYHPRGQDVTLMWPEDKYLPMIFDHEANAGVIAFLRENAPSGSVDLIYELLHSADGLNGAMLYCPDEANSAYMALYTPNNVIFGLALGTSLLVYRVPGHSHTIFEPLGKDWLYYSMWRQSSSLMARRIDIRGYCRTAYQMALRA